MNIKVKTLFQGKVAVRDRYINEAIKKEESLEITCQSGVMEIPHDQIKSKIVGKSDSPFKDRYSKEFHFLIYFKWHPKVRQKQLFNLSK